MDSTVALRKALAALRRKARNGEMTPAQESEWIILQPALRNVIEQPGVPILQETLSMAMARFEAAERAHA